MDKPKTIVVTIKGMISENDLSELKKISEVKYVEKEKVSQQELAEFCEGYDYLMLNYDVVKNLDEEFYSNSKIKSLKGISADITGVSWANPKIAKEKNIALMNVPNYCTESVCESIILETLLHSRKINLAYKDLIKGKEPESRKGINIENRTVGIIGLGNIGIRCSELFNGFGAKVIAWNRTKKEISSAKAVSIEEVFENSDIVCITIKTIDGENGTVGMINKKLLSKSKKDQIIINLADPVLVNNDDLLKEIESGKIIGYSTTRKSSVLEHKISKFDCVHLPPANAWFSDESLNNLKMIWVENVISSINGKKQNLILD